MRRLLEKWRKTPTFEKVLIGALAGSMGLLFGLLAW
jgi:hypothetical protein